MLTRYMNYFEMIDQDDLKLWEPLEADSYQTTGAHGLWDMVLLPSYSCKRLRLDNTTLKWICEDYIEMCELLIAFILQWQSCVCSYLENAEARCCPSCQVHGKSHVLHENAYDYASDPIQRDHTALVTWDPAFRCLGLLLVRYVLSPGHATYRSSMP